jgi:2-polyprenyl-6-methoxyphenol hydroxylase-like FAD-dependent oxidoreductase
MTISEKHIGVLIVGAGPSGLMMAAQLLRYGVQPVIIDSKQGPTDESRALGVQARSLEIYRQMGIVEPAIRDGKKASGLSFNRDGEPVATFAITNIGEGQTPFPYVLLYQQSKNERLLLDYLTRACCPVYWETTLESLKQTATSVDIQLIAGNGKSNHTADWVIGADGAHSVVRKQLSIPFSGETYSHTFYLADVEFGNQDLDDDMISLFMEKNGIAAFFPMPEPRRFRVIGNLPDALDDKKDLLLEDILPGLNNICKKDFEVNKNYWFTIYRLHHRMAEKFREQRCFLIGDAAHIHSPVGAQGMNTGLQDAYNLAWKLAGVVNRQLKPGILDSYAAERMPVAKTLLSTTDKAFTLIMSRNPLTSLFKKWVLPNILKWAWGKQTIREAFFVRLSQIGIGYRDSPISLQISQSAKVKAGDRLPYFKIYDEKKQEETDLHAWCAKPGFTLLLFGKLAETDLFTLAKWITQNYPAVLNFFYLPPSPKNLAVFEAFEMKENQARSVIVRPDMHIGFMNDKVDMVLMDNYLRSVVGVMPPKITPNG